LLVPAEFLDGGGSAARVEVGGVGGGQGGGFTRERGEGGSVEMIEMGVGKEDEVDVGELARGEGSADEAFGAEGAEAGVDAEAEEEGWVSEDMEAMEVDEDGGMAEPGEAGRRVLVVQGATASTLFARRRAVR
jgi:hypothetical protein